MSPGMPIFPVSPERVAGTRPPYNGPAPPSPSLPDLRPLRTLSHRRNDSDVSVHGLAAMFENLEVKDFKEAQSKYLAALQKQKTKHAKEIVDMENRHRLAIGRFEVRCDELKSDLKRAQEVTKDTIDKHVWDKERQDHREALAKWEKALAKENERRKQIEAKLEAVAPKYQSMKTAAEQYKKMHKEAVKEKMDAAANNTAIGVKLQSMQRKARTLESDLNYQTAEAEKYKNQVYSLQVDLESAEARLGEQIQTLTDKLKLIEGERDALKTSLKEEEVMRIAAEGQIPLPTASNEEEDEFASPVRSPRKRSPMREEEDKENVAPKKAVVELHLLQQELSSEKRLRERAQEQIDFMKMECQFQCCSCRIADIKGAKYVHDGSYATEMERIKASVPMMTPPPSDHDDEVMEDIKIKEEPMDDERPFTPLEHPEDPVAETTTKPSTSPEPLLAFSPTTGTFRSVPSPAKVATSTFVADLATPARLGLSSITEVATASSPWTPDANSTVIRTEPESPTLAQEPEQEPQPEPEQVIKYESKSVLKEIVIHEDAIVDDEDDVEEEATMEPQTPLHGPSGPATPGQYLTRTITTTTTIPLHFSPLTPAAKKVDQPMTPSTIAHAPTTAQSKVLGELNLNNLPFDREAALEAIRERRGRARSMAIGHGTPRKQMMEGVKERRDISAPVSRARR
ncbi:hypothetical protein BDV96DRAFT_642129 [Lophiotrema nucula]|uniref:Uncharacterized protein n=1 Tax=Lophiotrema nucula TaxID=690887 RepID=A0A6A5ZKV8_9PLEO|nr:hypothetical protein BDV96DRAFT_642129 [Lophiotrema nucula]